MFYEDRLYDATPETIVAIVKETPAAIGTLVVVGHNPGLHEAARLLIAAGDVEARERLNEGTADLGACGDRFRGRRLGQAPSPQRAAGAIRDAAPAQDRYRLTHRDDKTVTPAVPAWQDGGVVRVLDWERTSPCTIAF